IPRHVSHPRRKRKESDLPDRKFAWAATAKYEVNQIGGTSGLGHTCGRRSCSCTPAMGTISQTQQEGPGRNHRRKTIRSSCHESAHRPSSFHDGVILSPNRTAL